MASAIIHLAVAKELIKSQNIADIKDYFLGSIAPDISKQIGQSKEKSHFLYNTEKDIPNINRFINKYPNFKYNSFNLGYFIHLYTDKLWYENFLKEIVSNNTIKLLIGEKIEVSNEEITKIIYSDYTNLNISLIDNHNLDLELFYEEFKLPKTHLTEIPTEHLDILINKMGIIIENSKKVTPYTFNINEVEKFINFAVQEIIKELKKY